MDKTNLLERLISAISTDLSRARAAADASKVGAIHEENRAEGSKDMRSTEASYLARGQAMRVEELEEALLRLSQMTLRIFGEDTPISAGAIVCLENQAGEERWYWLVSDGAGYSLTMDNTVITTITPRSPLGRELVERHLYDEIDLLRGDRQEQFEIIKLL